MAVQLTPEQRPVLSVRNGFRVICANAGTGKTFTLCELFLELYQEEERRLYPGQGHVGGDEQRFLLRQFLVVTFTVAAAAELNQRILKRFAELGIPEPPKSNRGAVHRICRTLDSFIQSWFMKPRVFSAWMDADPDAERSIRRSIAHLPESARALLAQEDSANPEYTFYRKWAWLTGDTVDNIILDSIMRERLGLDPLPGISPMSEWAGEWERYLQAFTPPATDSKERWGQNFWDSKIAPYQEYYKQMRQLSNQWRAGLLANHPEAERLVRDLAVWEQVFSARRDFSSIYEIARAKGYHPVRGFDNLAKLSILNEIAAAQYIQDFREVHEISLRYYAMKVRHHLMDHGDFLNTFVDALERNPSLVEPTLEYPRFGIRAKYLIYDEAQDNSPYQNKVIYLLKPRHGVPTLCAVCGDAKQAIYAFRGACSYGFGNMLEKAVKKDPKHVLTLTCSFRSARLITELGNVIASTLPRYAKNVFPSETIFKEAGKIVVAPPMKTAGDEAAWTLEQINGILAASGGRESIMVLQRNNFDEHPILSGLRTLEEQYGEKVVRHLTIHRSKGLEADHVFVLGLTATIMPDPRGNETQEINLFYVACTRPRKALYLCCLYQKKKVDELGRTSWESVGPSPFIKRVTMLDDAADRAGWPFALRETGENSHKAAVARFIEAVRKKESKLRQQWREMFPDIPLRHDPDDEPTDEVGGAPVPEEIRRLQKKSLFDEQGQALDESAFKLDTHLKERVERRLADGFLKNGDVPRLSRQEFAIAITNGWVIKNPDNGRLRFSNNFLARANGPRRS